VRILDYKTVKEKDNAVILQGVKNFEPTHIFECGQCFRWNKLSEDCYEGVALGRVLRVTKKLDEVKLEPTTLQEFYELWENYFDLKRDYSLIKEQLSKDPLLAQAVEFGRGIRLLSQEPFELIISFIISANNRIPMIKRAVEEISRRYGSTIEYQGKTYYTFPALERLSGVSLEELQSCGVGFRAKYIYETVKKIKAENNLHNIIELCDDECYDLLQNYAGIGPKVADCIMLFSMGKYSAFPVDVWVKRAMMHFYVAPDVSLPRVRAFAREKFGILSGFAQQYLFYYARENNIKI